MKNKFKKIISITLGLSLTFVTQLNLIPFGNEVTAFAAALNTSRVSVHDPSIAQAGGKYYLFGSHRADAVSSDLASWNYFQTNINNDYANIFSVGGKWAAHGSNSYDITGNLWAPDVIYNPQMKKWCIYMSVNGDKFYSSIALATSNNITGPYKYAGTIVYSGFTNSSLASQTDYSKVTGTNNVASRYLSKGAWNSSYGPNAIDPCVKYDKSGNLWLSYGSWFGGIFMLKLDKSTGLRDYSYTYSTKTNASDQYLGIKISGGYGTCGEGSYIVYDKATDYYYLYESYCGLDATDNFSGYHIRLFRSKNITGPYTDAKGNPAICTSANDNKSNKGIKLFGNYYFSSLSSVNGSELSSKGYMSGGHNSAIIDTSGQRYLIYHTRFNNGTEAHQIRVHQQFLNEDGWPVTAVYEYLGSQISKSGYSSNDIIGTYEFINHGLNATTAKTGMLKTSKVSLNANGSISGDYTGTWVEKSGSYYCNMVIGGITYKGIFFKQYDESASHKNTMTFSLIGSNNESIWGSKISGSTINPSPKLDGTYYIKSSLSGMYLDVANGQNTDGTNIRQWTPLNNNAQKFKIVSDSDGCYHILTGASNYKSCIDVTNNSSSNGSNIEEWSYWNGDMQKFKIQKVSENKYAILTKSSNFKSCLDVYNMSKDSGANVCQWNYWGGNGQLWELIPN
ncbi:arabinan endo-1,5-alpha-L-arabinosidase [Clostridium acetobutylicum]|uniref:Endo-arabinase related enzyme (Family 43 glycosyl hydrolase domain and ricin B-like domain) n=1 Tax=Clostridium acetobutylicum (strain ATCC 824 / DSM 792 / JCM 1419 / IAM 19013 / LMG 5710 / NBRC 13948 / NRRL B-527 / VKM B-1787 / 2291 / W) TaxID=272562 RepID=Q97LI4_CLOAB|nr:MULTISPECIES: RICIN domain-containing protein [Clostridium]AAK78555.1 Endo-arabinase related enzyme (family 43 glycosyl hydrolase domain and ricin B-like domain) [Clostridium acetobutylicum ATCC 824]ADZ19629.1 Endo-arabinase related enzyme (family 43 glycosyl hydrolase domain and ricin B-like domain) [Clostridium acetobutylicum EA 2018]AEI33332.1 endo-arabinase-like protein [Clostridium acetobutylicum DSM 1731]AWV80279.1 glycoside hydrolase family 43 protein [Clostridium acetobutylicum]MBC2